MRSLLILLFARYVACMDPSPSPPLMGYAGRDPSVDFFAVPSSQNDSMAILLSAPAGSQDDGLVAPVVLPVAERDPFNLTTMTVFLDDNDTMAGIMGFRQGDTFTVSPYQVTHTHEAYSTIPVADDQVRNASIGEIIFQAISFRGDPNIQGHAIATTPMIVLVNATTFLVNESDHTFQAVRGVYVQVNPARSLRDDRQRVFIAAFNGNAEFWLDTARINPTPLTDARPGAKYDDYESRFIRQYELKIKKTFINRTWQFAARQVQQINNATTGAEAALMNAISPDTAHADILISGVHDVISNLRATLVNNIVATEPDDVPTVQFIREQFDAIVALIADLNQYQNENPATEILYNEGFGDSPSPIFGNHFRNRGPTSPELENLQIVTVVETMTAAREAINGLPQTEQGRLWQMFTDATNMLHQENPLGVLRRFLEEAGLPIVHTLDQADAQHHTFLDAAIRVGLAESRNARHANEVLTRQLAESAAALQEARQAQARSAHLLTEERVAHTGTTATLTEERAAHARADATLTEERAAHTRTAATLTEERAAHTRTTAALTEERSTAARHVAETEARLSALRASLAQEHDNKMKEMDERHRRETAAANSGKDAEIEKIKKESAARLEAARAELQRFNEGANDNIRRLEGEIERLKKSMEDTSRPSRAVPPPVVHVARVGPPPTAPLPVVVDSDESQNSWNGESAEHVAQTQADLAVVMRAQAGINEHVALARAGNPRASANNARAASDAARGDPKRARRD